MSNPNAITLNFHLIWIVWAPIFAFDRTIQIMDECATESHTCQNKQNSECSNTEGSFRCPCAFGYVSNDNGRACEGKHSPNYYVLITFQSIGSCSSKDFFHSIGPFFRIRDYSTFTNGVEIWIPIIFAGQRLCSHRPYQYRTRKYIFPSILTNWIYLGNPRT